MAEKRTSYHLESHGQTLLEALAKCRAIMDSTVHSVSVKISVVGNVIRPAKVFRLTIIEDKKSELGIQRRLQSNEEYLDA